MAPLFNIIALRTAMIGHPPCARPSNTSHPSPVMRIAARPIGESSPPHARSPPSAHRADTSPGGATSVDGHPDKRAPPRCAPHSHLTAPLRSCVSAPPLCMHAPPRVRLSADLRRARALSSLEQSSTALTPYPFPPVEIPTAPDAQNPRRLLARRRRSSASRRVPPAVAAWARACACALPLLVAAVASLRAVDARTAAALGVCLAVGGCLARGGVVPVPSLAPEQTAAEVPPILRPGIRSASGRVGLLLGAQTDDDPVLSAQSAKAWAWLYDSGEWPRLPRVESRRALHDEVLAGLRVERQSVPPPTGWRQRLLGLLARFLLADGPGRLVLSLVARRMRAATLAGPERYYLPDDPDDCGLDPSSRRRRRCPRREALVTVAFS